MDYAHFKISIYNFLSHYSADDKMIYIWYILSLLSDILNNISLTSYE